MRRRHLKHLGVGVAALTIAYLAVISIPLLLSAKIEYDRKIALEELQAEFPVTVDPGRKLITETEAVNAYLDSEHSPLSASVGNVGVLIGDLFAHVASLISSTFLYSPIAAVHGRLVTIHPGFRKEQVANTFGQVLGWTEAEKRAFLTLSASSSPETDSLTEGYFAPGVYVVASETTPEEARAQVKARFEETILARYTERVAEAVPLKDALTIASLIQREAAGPVDMRLVSGVIWNRLFVNMRLQIDATVQYVRANTAPTGSWWPAARPADLFVKSPYNTYVNKGLPPGPIANPSVAAVVAALNPVSTECIFYFHDRLGEFHCSPNYAGHVALLKKYYGRGK